MQLSRLIRDLFDPVVLLWSAAVGVGLSVWLHEARGIAGQLITPFLMTVLFSLFARVSLTRLVALSQLIEPMLEIPSLIVFSAFMKLRAQRNTIR